VNEYDSPFSTYDSGLSYDSAPLPQPFTEMSKLKIKQNLKYKTDSELLVYAQQHEAAMIGNANFTTPLPSVTDFTSVRAAYAVALGNFNTAQQAAKQATTIKDAARADLETALTARGDYVQLTSAGRRAVAESSGFSVKSAQTPASVPAPVASLAVTAGDNAGELDLQWDPTAGANRYEVQLCATPEFATGVSSLPSVQKSKAVATGLTSGSRMWARVRALNAAGPGAWSDVGTKIVP